MLTKEASEERFARHLREIGNASAGIVLAERLGPYAVEIEAAVRSSRALLERLRTLATEEEWAEAIAALMEGRPWES